jgi:hypothetical protein
MQGAIAVISKEVIYNLMQSGLILRAMGHEKSNVIKNP